MKKILSLFLILLIIPLVSAQEDPGVTPDSFVWGLDKALENINLLLTLNPQKKAEKRLQIAQERLLEVKTMIEANKLEHAEKAKNSHKKVIDKVKQHLDKAKKSDSTQEKSNLLQLENELDNHESKLEELSSSSDFKLEVEGELNPQQQEALKSLVDSLKQNSNEIKIKIKSKKDDLKIKIKQETGKSDQEIDEEFEENTEKQTKASQAINSAEQKLTELQTKLSEKPELNDKGSRLTELVKDKLNEAKEALEAKKYGRAYGLATAAESLVTNGLRKLENLKENKEKNPSKDKEANEELEESEEEEENKKEANEEVGELEEEEENKKEANEEKPERENPGKNN